MPRMQCRPQLLAAVLALLPLLATPATASANDALQLGLLAHDVPELWSHFNRESGVDLNAEWTPAWPGQRLGPATVGSQVGVTLNSAGDTSYMYGGLHLRLGQTQGWYARVGLGAALHNGETELVSNDRKALGARLLFHIPLELGYQWPRHSLSLYFSHISNGYTQDANEGLDTLGLRAGWRY